MPTHEEVFTTCEEVEVNFNLQINYEDASIESKGEHEIVIKEIEGKLFLRNEIKPQLEYSDLMFENFEEEMGFLENSLARDTGDENHKMFSDSIDFEEQIKCHTTITQRRRRCNC